MSEYDTGAGAKHAAAESASAISTRIATLLRRSAGLEVELLGSWGVEHAVTERIDALVAAGEPMNATRYLERIERDPAEQQWLIEAVVIPETWFFRHHESFDFIVASALKRLAGPDQPSRILRIASVPCSTGEEPYSIAMALLDAGIAPERFLIDAIDISHGALSQARAGLYRRNAFRSNRPGFQQRYFDAVDDGWQIKPMVRRCVTFRPGNLVTDVVFAQARQYDFVLCRNVLIYFDRPTQHAVVARLSQALRDDGHLLVGPAEAALLTRSGLVSTPAALAFAFHQAKSPVAPKTAIRGAAAATAATIPTTATATLPFGTAKSHRAPIASSLLANLAALTATAGHATNFAHRPARAVFPTTAAGVSANAAGVGESEADVALAEAKRLADAGQLKQAESACQALLLTRRGDANVDANIYCLLGLISDSQGRAQQAREHFRRAVYLDATHADALIQLATHLSRDGDEAAAERLLARARRARPDLF